MNSPGSTSVNPIGATTLFSLLLHAVLLLGVTFHFAQAEPGLPTLDVTLVNVANQEAPDKADFLAQANNTGGGQSDRVARPSQRFSGELPRPDPGVAAQPMQERTPATGRRPACSRVARAERGIGQAPEEEIHFREHQGIPVCQLHAQLV